MQAIYRGYNRRSRNLWSATRWQTFNIMCTGMADLSKAGIHNPHDLIKFPWDNETADDMPSQEWIDEMNEKLMAENRRLAAASQVDQNNQ